MPGRVPYVKSRPPRLPVVGARAPRKPEDAEWHRLLRQAPWQRCSAAYRAARPYCEVCLARDDKLVPVALVHHEHEHDIGRMFEWSGLWSLCRSCHRQVTDAETRGKPFHYPARIQPSPDSPGYA